MEKSVTNLILIIGLIAIVFAGFWLYTNNDSSLSLQFGAVDNSQVDIQKMLADTKKFEEHTKILEAVNLDLSILEDGQFRSLRNFSTEIETSPIGRDNPFEDIDVRTRN